MHRDRLRLGTGRLAALAAVLLALLLAAAGLARIAIPSRPGSAAADGPAAPSPALRPITEEELDVKYGIRITLVAVTAGGGLVDVRFRVQDRARAEVLFLPGNLPSIVARDGEVTIPPPQQPGAPTLADGQVYFLLYPNAGGAVQPGSRVVLAFQDLGLQVQVAP